MPGHMKFKNKVAFNSYLVYNTDKSDEKEEVYIFQKREDGELRTSLKE